MGDESKWKKHLHKISRHAKKLISQDHLKTLGDHARRLKDQTQFDSLKNALHHIKTKSDDDDKKTPGTSTGQKDDVVIKIGQAMQANFSHTKYRKRK